MLVLLRNNAGRHALVVVDGKNQYEARNERRGWTNEDCERGWLDDKTGQKLWKKPEGELWKRLEKGSYMAVECTGFAKTGADGRLKPTLSFNDACEEAKKKLTEMNHVATLDIARLQENKGYTAYALPDTVYKIIIQDYPILAHEAYDFSDLIVAETADFVGRDWVIEDLAQFRADFSAGYYCVIAQAGLGKTALAAEIAKRYQAPAFFLSVREGYTHTEQCLGHLAADLIARFSLAYDRLPKRATKDWNFVKTLLDEARKKGGQSLLVVIDAVDESEPTAGNVLLLPERSPEGVHIVLTSRTEPTLAVHAKTGKKVLPVAADNERHKEDIKAFVEARVTSLPLGASFASSVRRIVDTLIDASEYNFQYLQYVLTDLASLKPGVGGFQLPPLPRKLKGYYDQFWKGIEAVRDTEDWNAWNELYRPTIALLGVVLEPVTAKWLSALLKPACPRNRRKGTRPLGRGSSSVKEAEPVAHCSQVIFRLSCGRPRRRHAFRARPHRFALSYGVGEFGVRSSRSTDWLRLRG